MTEKKQHLSHMQNVCQVFLQLFVCFLFKISVTAYFLFKSKTAAAPFLPIALTSSACV